MITRHNPHAPATKPWLRPKPAPKPSLLPHQIAALRKAHHVPQALAAKPSDTARDLRDVKRDQAMTRRAWDILAEGGADSYTRAVAALREDTRSCWLGCLSDPPRDGQYAPTAEALKEWIDRRWDEWFEQPIAELEHRDAIREQAFGAAYATNRLETPARYEVHLDWKLERALSMLIRLRDLRPLQPAA
jgi:hypothetical protein